MENSFPVACSLLRFLSDEFQGNTFCARSRNHWLFLLYLPKNLENSPIQFFTFFRSLSAILLASIFLLIPVWHPPLCFRKRPFLCLRNIDRKWKIARRARALDGGKTVTIRFYAQSFRAKHPDVGSIIILRSTQAARIIESQKTHN